ncbi:hypothetical protein XM38_002730 [Halomicronema hongdechloris C2206]|uniref:Uncharacterized protein n=1 Tax=Halomicronema hongdechloris C2206 TaxID=1641165 RepID=A0A1Z3HGE5_9CYAN|nr:hypothetical protein XM38_002730 [Halomicronema hongdechloris C2206]
MEPPAIDVVYEFLKAYLGLLGSLSLFVLPILSMGYIPKSASKAP